MSLLARVQALGSGMWLRAVLKQQAQQTAALKQISADLHALTAAVARLVPPPADPEPRPADVAFADQDWVRRDDDRLRTIYDLQQELTRTRGDTPELEEVVEELERREAAADEAEALRRMADILGGRS